MRASRIFVSSSSAGTFENARKQPRDHLRVGDFSGVGENRIHRQADGQLPPFAVVNCAALRADFKDALLLVLGFGEVFAVAEKLEVTQAAEHRRHPNHRKNPDDKPAETRIALLHFELRVVAMAQTLKPLDSGLSDLKLSPAANGVASPEKAREAGPRT